MQSNDSSKFELSAAPTPSVRTLNTFFQTCFNSCVVHHCVLWYVRATRNADLTMSHVRGVHERFDALVDVASRTKRVTFLLVQLKYFEWLAQAVCGWIMHACGSGGVCAVVRCVQSPAELRMQITKPCSAGVFVFVDHEAEFAANGHTRDRPSGYVADGEVFVLSLHTEHTCPCKWSGMFDLGWHFSPSFSSLPCARDNNSEAGDKPSAVSTCFRAFADRIMFVPLFAHVPSHLARSNTHDVAFAQRTWDVCMPMNTTRRRRIATALSKTYALKVFESPWHDRMADYVPLRSCKVFLNVHARDGDRHYMESVRVAQGLCLTDCVVVAEQSVDSRAWRGLLHPALPVLPLEILCCAVACVCKDGDLWRRLREAQVPLSDFFAFRQDAACRARDLLRDAKCA